MSTARPAEPGRLCEHCSTAENVKTYDDELGQIDLCDTCEERRD